MGQKAKGDRFTMETVIPVKKPVSDIVENMFSNAGLPNPNQINQNWEEIEAMYQEIGSSFITIGQQINEAIRTINQIGLNNVTELVSTVNTASKDIQSFASKLAATHERHAGKTGRVDNGDELALCLDIANEYFMINDKFRVLIFPAILTITEHMADAMQKHEERQPLTIDQTNTTTVIENSTENPVQ